MTDTPWTVLRLLEWTTDFFRKKGSESPRLDAEILLAHARGCQRIELYTSFDQEPEEEHRIAFRELVRRRGEGAPVAQLVGAREFYAIPLRVDENVLIPRPETEHLVVEAIDRLKEMQGSDPHATRTILDVGTGSGAIAVALAKSLPNLKVTAVDISLQALEIARWNVEHQKLTERVELLQSDLLETLDRESKFDLICSNPPYVSQPEYDALPQTVKEYEPQTALLAGPTGTEIIERLLDQAADFLKPDGRLIIELSPMIADRVAGQVDERPQWGEARFIKDLAGHRRIISIAPAA